VAFWQAVGVAAIEHFARLLFGRYLTTAVSGREHLPDGPVLICSNHASHLDSAALMLATGRPFDTFRLLAAADYFTSASLAGRLTRAHFRLVAIDRSGGHAARLRQTVAACRREGPASFIAFPEGTRSTTGHLLPFKRGAAFLAVALGVPVVPAYIHGTEAALPKGRWLPRRAAVRVHFGPPIGPAAWVARHRGEASSYVATELERRVRALSGQLGTEIDGAVPSDGPSAPLRARCRGDRRLGQTARMG